MQTQQISRGRRFSATVLIAGVLAATGCTLPTTGAPVERDRAEQAWTDRLNGEAQAASDRFEEEAQVQRANEAYSQRLLGQARAYREEQSELTVVSCIPFSSSSQLSFANDVDMYAATVENALREKAGG